MLVVAGLAGTTTLVLLYRRIPGAGYRKTFAFARVSAALAVAAVIAGWGVGQYPWMLVGQLTIREAAGATPTLTALLVVVVLAGVIVLPPLGYLLWFTQSDKPAAREVISP